MRVSTFIIFDQLTKSLQNNLDKYSSLNDQLATGRKFAKPSEDVFGMGKSLDFQVSINSNNQYRKNIDSATTRLRLASISMQSVSQTLAGIHNAISLSTTNSADQKVRDGYALTTAQYRDQLFSIANTTVSSHQYIFSGYKTDTPAYSNAPGYAYQGDSGVMNVQIDHSAVMPVNITGDQAFSYTLGAPGATDVKQLSDGMYAHYTQGAGTAITVDIRQADDISRPLTDDTFTFSNIMQITDLLSSALTTNKSSRILALADPVDKMSSQAYNMQSEIGARISGLTDQSSRLQDTTDAMQTSLATTINANPLETTAQLKQVEVTLSALRDSASRVISQSLMDFLR